MKQGIMRFLAALLVGAAFLGVTAKAYSQDAEPSKDKPAGTYGKTPDTVIPFRDFREPYVRFFQDYTAYLGSGREDALTHVPRTVRIGFIGPTRSAPDADLGEYMYQGALLAVEQANTAGGYEGLEYELVRREDLGLWGASSNTMVSFKYDDDVLAVIGSIDGANTHIALRVALKIKMVIVNTGTTDPTLTETNIPWLLRCMADDRQQGYALAYHMFEECGLERVAALRVNDRFGRTGIGEFRDAATRLKHPLLVEVRWNHGSRDFTAQLDRIADVEADAIVLWGNASDSAAVVREIRERKMAVRIFGCDRLVSKKFLEEAGPAAEGVVAVATYDPSSNGEAVQVFSAVFSERFGREPETFAAHAYDGANILIEAIRRGGLNCARIRDALYEVTQFEGVTGRIHFDTTLNDIGPVHIAAVQNGAFIYEDANFTRTAGAKTRNAPYRKMTDAPPSVRSPDSNARRVADVYRLGCFVPLDATGKAVVDGMKKALTADAAQHPEGPAIELIVRDSRGTWGQDSSALVDLAFTNDLLAIIGSTERRGTHLAETLAAKIHFPIVTLCGTDSTITAIPLPWVFCVAPGERQVRPDVHPNLLQELDQEAYVRSAALGSDAVNLLVSKIRAGANTRVKLRGALASGAFFSGMTGTFTFDALGRRVDLAPYRASTPASESPTAITQVGLASP